MNLIPGKYYVLDQFARPRADGTMPDPLAGPFDTKAEAEAERVQLNIADDCYIGRKLPSPLARAGIAASEVAAIN
jgi:hypothetical protein